MNNTFSLTFVVSGFYCLFELQQNRHQSVALFIYVYSRKRKKYEHTVDVAALLLAKKMRKNYIHFILLMKTNRCCSIDVVKKKKNVRNRKGVAASKQRIEHYTTHCLQHII